MKTEAFRHTLYSHGVWRFTTCFNIHSNGSGSREAMRLYLIHIFLVFGGSVSSIFLFYFQQSSIYKNATSLTKRCTRAQEFPHLSHTCTFPLFRRLRVVHRVMKIRFTRDLFVSSAAWRVTMCVAFFFSVKCSLTPRELPSPQSPQSPP